MKSPARAGSYGRIVGALPERAVHLLFQTEDEHGGTGRGDDTLFAVYRE